MKFLLCLGLFQHVLAASANLVGLQSGPDRSGSSYVASAVYSASDHTIVMTGTTYGSFWSNDQTLVDTSGCFLAIAKIDAAAASWKQSIHLSVPGIPEGCSDLFLMDDQTIWLTGFTTNGGILDTIKGEVRAETPRVQNGMLVQVRRQGLDLVGGHVIEDEAVVYPTHLAHTIKDNNLYLTAMETNNVVRNDQVLTSKLDPAVNYSHGAGFDLTFSRWEIVNVTYNATQLQSSVLKKYRKYYGTASGDEVQVGGVVKKDKIVVVAGSTRGGGSGFGAEPAQGDYDGFIMKLNTYDGNLAVDPQAPTHPSSIRIQSINQKDDWVYGICQTAYDPQHVFIAGATKGQLDIAIAGSTNNPSTQAFLQKIDLNTLAAVWTVQLGADTPTITDSVVKGISCEITNDGSVIYFGGIVEAGAVLPNSGTDESFGGNDIFVAAVDTKKGNTLWVRQVGSKEDDQIALRRGLATDTSGNVIVVGYTKGSFYRKKTASDQNADVFILSMSRSDGQFQIPVDHPDFKPSDGVSAAEPSADSGVEQWASLTIILIVLSVAIMGASCFAGHLKKHREVNTDRGKVLGYLSEFEIEDIDLKHSATGGWHCSYTNDLARGVNNRTTAYSGLGGSTVPRASHDPLMAPLTDSKIVQESLFMEEDEPATLSSGYDGLVDAYNSSWSDRSRQRSGWGRDIV